MSNNSIILSNLDFDRLKNTFKSYLRGQERFQDYDLEGSNISVLLDLMSYNTYMNSFYLNMVGNEMFLDTAQLRDSVISHAKELNYVPRSFTSAKAKIALQVITSDPNKKNIFVPRGTTFTAKNDDSSSYTFVTDQNITINNKLGSNNTNAVFYSDNISIYEGTYVTESYTINPGTETRFLITNPKADTSSLRVTVLEDLGATALAYNRAQTLFDLDENSKVYFLQGAENYQYEIVFGDGIVGRQPKNGAVVLLEYRVCNGELPNGLNRFTNDGSIDGETNIQVATIEKATSGSISESNESIKFSAPRAFTTQERAVTNEDFENLLKINFPEINAVSAFGGETLSPPQYGKVFVAVDLIETDKLPQSKVDEYYQFLKPRSVVSIDPVFVNPDYTYIAVTTNIKYNINTTPLNADDIRTLALSAIIKFSQDNINSFNKTLRYSKLVNAIDNSSSGIISNDTDIVGIKYFIPTSLNSNENYQLNFGFSLKPTTAGVTSLHQVTTAHAIFSTAITYNNQRAYLEDDGAGLLNFVTIDLRTGQHQILGRAGRVDYDNGILYLDSFNIADYEGNQIKIYGRSAQKDIVSTKDIILNIVDSDVNVAVTEVRD